jgi:hypothetical protein
MLVKFYGATSKGAKGSPAECIGARKMPISSQWSCSRLPAILQPRLREALLQELALASKLPRDVRCSTDLLQIPEILNQKNASVSIGVGSPDR